MSDTTRRNFLAGAAAIATQAHPILGANERVNLAVVGLGGRGNNHMDFYLKIPQARIMALCDVNQAALERGQAKVNRGAGENPKGYSDMRKLFDDKEVEAVSIATPNHWHALSAIWAMQAGKDVYCEKPASHNIFEGYQMVAAARKYGRMCQIGSQSRTIAHKVKAMKLLEEGVIGKVYMGKALCFKRRKSIGKKADEPVPPGLDWSLFLGPAPMRPYNELRFRYNWHWFWDTGNGDIGNQGVHEMDIMAWGLGKTTLPKSVMSTGGKLLYDDDQETPNTQMATFDWGDGVQGMFEVRGLITGGEGSLVKRGANTIGNLFYGADGWMAVDGSGFQVFKGENDEKVMDEKRTDNDTVPHMQNFLDAVKSRKYQDLHAEIEIGARAAALCHFANVSYRVGRKLTWDDKTRKFVGDVEANKMVSRDYRKPYVVPEKV
ncbi:MAG: Gfo/Idh/MocA family oxidoreductase [Bryobacteraceae bacterium]|nr:Gfo/Idh/MocA family oxidoreductase [Bryobacteraceae bacterium]